MNHDEELSRIEEKIDGHIVIHDQDNKKLLWWIISTLITLLVIGASGFMSLGEAKQKISNIEVTNLELKNNQKDFVTRAELSGAIALFNNKIDNLSEKIDRLILK
jgi:hypothetical protein